MNTCGALTADRLREFFSYDPETGLFVRKKAKTVQSQHHVGKTCDSINKFNGYVEFHVGGQKHRAHRLAWLYVYGVWPSGEIDHINRTRHDNRISNLRDVTHENNTQNAVKPMPSSKSGIRGVSWSTASQRWTAAISVKNKVRNLGRYMTQEEAHAAYLKARKELHAGFIA